jgi:endoglucanase
MCLFGSQGHFQIIMSREHSPLFQKRLTLGMKILYCSGVWSYVVGALTTPLFIVIPLLTVWAGVFPIVVSWWAAVALTAYMTAQTLVLNYTHKRKHVQPLWFASVANNIMWWTYVKACWRSLYSLFGAPCKHSRLGHGCGFVFPKPSVLSQCLHKWTK